LSYLIRKAILCLQAKYVTPRQSDIDKFRDDFLVLMKNVKLLSPDDKETAEEFKQIANRYTVQLRGYLQSLLKAMEEKKTSFDLNQKHPKFYPYVSRVWAQVPFYVKQSKVVWSFLHELQDLYYGDALSSWASRTKRKARAAWKWFETVLSFIDERRTSGGTEDDLKMQVLEEELVSTAGFDVQLVGYEDTESHQKWLGILRSALRVFKEKANKVVPWIVEYALPFRVEFSFERGSSAGAYGYSGTYEYDHINVYPWSFGDVNKVVHTLAHEMGHHMFRSMSAEHVKEFTELMKGNEEWDLMELVLLYDANAEESELAFEQRIKSQYPDIYYKWMAAANKYEGYNFHFIQKVVEYLQGGGDPKVNIPSKIVTPYGTKNPEEAFCETVGMLVAYGSRTVDEEVRELFKKLKL